MRRADLKTYARVVASEVEQQSYEHWALESFPLTFERTWKGQTINVEVERLSIDEETIQLGVAVDDGSWLSGRWPVGVTVVIRKG